MHRLENLNRLYKGITLTIIILFLASACIAISVSVLVSKNDEILGILVGSVHNSKCVCDAPECNITSSTFGNTGSMIDNFCSILDNTCVDHIYTLSRYDRNICEKSSYEFNQNFKYILIVCFVLVFALCIFRQILIVNHTDQLLLYIVSASCIVCSIVLLTVLILWANTNNGHVKYRDTMGGHIQGYYSNYTTIPHINWTFTNRDTFARYYCTAYSYLYDVNASGYLEITQLDKCKSSINIYPIIFIILTILFVIVEIIYYKLLNDLYMPSLGGKI